MSSNNQQPQQQDETFTDPNANIVPETPDVEGADPAQTELHNKEVTRDPKQFVKIRQVFTTEQEDPMPQGMSEATQTKLANFTQAQADAEKNKEELARLGWKIWQAKQLYYYAYRQVGYNEIDKMIEWEERGYVYHQLKNEDKMKIKTLQGEIKTLETKNNLFQAGVLNDFLYREIFMMQKPIDVIIEEKKDQLAKTKFTAYFLEDDQEILKEINDVDIRDLVEAAEYRETQVPFSRKRDSWVSTSGSSVAKVKTK